MRHLAWVISLILLCSAACPAEAGPGSVAVYSNRCREAGTGHVRGFRLIVVDEGGREISLIYPRSETEPDIWPLHYGEWKDFRKGKLDLVADRAQPMIALHGTVASDAIVLAPDGLQIGGVSRTGPAPVTLSRVTLPEHVPDCQPAAPGQ